MPEAFHRHVQLRYNAKRISLRTKGELVRLIKPIVRTALNKLGYAVCRIPNEISETEISFPDYVSRELERIEKSAGNSTRSDIFKKLRTLSLTDFGLFLLSIPNPDFPELSA